jgi:hypothetical protein
MLYSKAITNLDVVTSVSVPSSRVIDLHVQERQDVVIYFSQAVKIKFAAASADIATIDDGTYFPIQGGRDNRFILNRNCRFIGIIATVAGYMDLTVRG